MASIFEQQARDINSLKRQNRAMLDHASQQNQQLQHLHNQLAQASAIQQETLRNQLQQAQEAFEQKMYKDLLFLVENIMEIVHEINDPIIKYYFTKVHYSIFKMHCEIAMETLTEIIDKQAAKKIILQLDNEIKTQSQVKQNYENSKLAQYINLQEEYEKHLAEKPTSIISEPIKPPQENVNKIQLLSKWGIPLGVALIIVGFFISMGINTLFGILLFILIGPIVLVVGIMNKSKIKKLNQMITKYNSDLENYKKYKSDLLTFENKSQEYPIHSLEKEIDSKYPGFKTLKDKIDNTILKFNTKWKSDN